VVLGFVLNIRSVGFKVDDHCIHFKESLSLHCVSCVDMKNISCKVILVICLKLYFVVLLLVTSRKLRFYDRIQHRLKGNVVKKKMVEIL